MNRVAIVGAGLAGLLCAQRLRRRGIHCIVFEKSRGLGGRLARRQHPWGELDVGAPLLSWASPPDDWLRLEQSGLLCGQHFKASQWQAGRLCALPDQFHYVAAPSNNRLCHYLAREIDVRTSCRVAAIDDGELIDDGGRELGRFGAVVLAAPAPQSRALLPKGCALLPQRRWLPGWTMLMQFDEPLAVAEIVEFVDHPLCRRLVHLSSVSGREHRACYSLQLLPEACAALAEKDGEHVLLQCLDALSQLAPLPALLRWDRQCWRLASGEAAVMSDEDRVDSQRRIVVAGDWCSGGGVEGAWRSAELAVAQVGQWQLACH